MHFALGNKNRAVQAADAGDELTDRLENQSSTSSFGQKTVVRSLPQNVLLLSPNLKPLEDRHEGTKNVSV